MNLKKVKETFVKLLLSHTTPHEIALGVAIGAFIAILPVYGLHTVLAIIAALLIRRANIIAILLGTNVSLPPTVPFITWGGYEIGKIILRKNYPDLNAAYFQHMSFQKIKVLYYPLFTGSVILGILTGIGVYFITLLIIKKIKGRKSRGGKE